MDKDNSILSISFMDAVAAAYGEPYDDRTDNISHPALSDLAKEFKTSTVKIRKILITRGLYSTEVIRKVIQLREQGQSIGEISKITGLKPAAVKASLPYEKGVYNIDPKTSLGIRVERNRKRKAVAENFRKLIDSCSDNDYSPCFDALWDCVVLYQGYPFMTSGRGGKGAVKFRYYLKVSSRTGKATEEIIIDRKEHSKTITRSTIELAFINAMKEQEIAGYVKGPKKLGCFGASYLYAMFIAWYIIQSISPADEL